MSRAAGWDDGLGSEGPERTAELSWPLSRFSRAAAACHRVGLHINMRRPMGVCSETHRRATQSHGSKRSASCMSCYAYARSGAGRAVPPLSTHPYIYRQPMCTHAWAFPNLHGPEPRPWAICPLSRMLNKTGN
ncbi:hypothetical protein CDD83_243 [Cordyceps sp. RAO-2017]|nr:hypothetical protein CDD83_243 [Cordyceps sp. RAO-2017]